MAQKNISDYYQFVKKNLDVLNSLSNKISNAEATSTPTKRKNTDDEQLDNCEQTAGSRLFKRQKASLIFDTELSPIEPSVRSTPTKSPPIRGQQSILKWVKSTNKLNRIINHGFPNSDLIQIIPCQLPDLPVRLNAFPQTTGSECKAKKRLFNDGFAELHDQIKSKATDGWLWKCRAFQETVSKCKPKTSRRSVLPIGEKQVQRKAAATDLIRSSPRKCIQTISQLFFCKSNNEPAAKKLDESVVKCIEAPAKKSEDELPLGSPPDKGLVLPEKYLKLATTFNHLETVVTIMYNRQETCTFDKAKEGVQKLTKKNFDRTHLAQMLTIYPNAYKLNYEKLTSIAKVNNDRKDYSLVIKPNVLSSKMIPYTNRMRMNEFQENLLQFAKKAHNDYLLSQAEPVLVNSAELVRWHPSFIFPDIPEAKLPEQPIESPAAKSIRDFWFKLKFEQESPKSACAPVDNSTKIKKGVLKGISQNLLDRVSVFMFRLCFCCSTSSVKLIEFIHPLKHRSEKKRRPTANRSEASRWQAAAISRRLTKR